VVTVESLFYFKKARNKNVLTLVIVALFEKLLKCNEQRAQNISY